MHVDVSDMSARQRENIARWWQALERVFFGVVTPRRRDNNYARSVDGISNLADWQNDRYRSLNVAAFHKFKTYEIRLHQGTVSTVKVAAWARLMLSFFETFQAIQCTSERRAVVYQMTDRERLIFLFQQVKAPMSLRKYFVKRAKRHGTGYLNMHKRPKSERKTLYV
jgi:hypothetical protein